MKIYTNFTEFINEVLQVDNLENFVFEGGAAGHMMHPFDDHSLTFADFKTIVRSALQGGLDFEEAPTEKTDGQNVFATVKDGKTMFARNKGQLANPLDLNGIIKMFTGHASKLVEETFIFAAKDLAEALPKLKDQSVFQDGRSFINMELIYSKNPNVIYYDRDVIQFHGMKVTDGNGGKTDNSGGGGTGALAEQVCLSSQAVFPIPDELHLSSVANIGRNYCAAYHSIKVIGNCGPGDLVLVDGASGGVGMASVELAKARGATVIAGVSHTTKAAMLTQAQAGADKVLVYGRDKESGEFSIYNTLNYRNDNVRSVLNKLSAERSEQFGYRSGSSVNASVHMVNRNFFHMTTSLGEVSKPDNQFVQHPIPQNDFGYSWITASATNSKFQFVEANDGFGHQHSFSSGSAKSIQFLSASDFGSFYMIFNPGGGPNVGRVFGMSKYDFELKHFYLCFLSF